MKYYRWILLFLSLLPVTGYTATAVWVPSGTDFIVTGFNDVSVSDGSGGFDLYDVKFIDGTRYEVAVVAASVSEAERFSQALMGAFDQDEALDFHFDEGTGATGLSKDSNMWGIMTPHGPLVDGYVSYYIDWGQPPSGSGAIDYVVAGTQDPGWNTELGDYVYAEWEVSAVPLPAAIYLFVPALAGLGFISRKRKPIKV
ncbi:MAG: VPLPA-CTERM sorting domain-containing protein [Candidatus Sedimenticola sp. (ex Thyasira tokunagai)]